MDIGEAEYLNLGSCGMGWGSPGMPLPMWPYDECVINILSHVRVGALLIEWPSVPGLPLTTTGERGEPMAAPSIYSK